MRDAVVRYRAAVDMKNELDPNFVVMAQCYARDAKGGTIDDTVSRLRAYREKAGVDWVQFESPHSVDEVRQARAAVKGVLSFMKGKMPRYLSAQEHLALGVNVAWYPGFTHHVMWAAVWDFMRDVEKVATCLPGVSLDGPERDGRVAGRMAVKLGPMSPTFAGTATVRRFDASTA